MGIKEILESYGDNGGWYNPRRILEHYDDTAVFFIIGQRRIGKTQLFVRLACDLWQQCGRKTFWLRDYDKQLQDPQFFGSFLTDAQALGWAPESWTADEEGIHDGDEIIIRFKGINTFGNSRGGSWPDVDLIVQDEMMPEDGRYPKGCAKGLMSLSKTILNGREDARIFCLSNYTSPMNPYFKQFRIVPKQDDGVTAFPDKGVLIEVCAADTYRCSISKSGVWERVYKAGQYGDYAGADEFSLSKLVKRRPKGNAEALAWLIYDGDYTVRAWSANGLLYWAQSERPRNVQVFASEVSYVDDKTPLIPKWLIKQMKEASDAGVYRYEDPNVMLSVMGLFYDV